MRKMGFGGGKGGGEDVAVRGKAGDDKVVAELAEALELRAADKKKIDYVGLGGCVCVWGGGDTVGLELRGLRGWGRGGRLGGQKIPFSYQR
jgi:hypothetical protein